MEETSLVYESVKFMLLGMGIVYLFLVVMVFVMNIMSNIINKYFPEPHPAENVETQQTTKNDKTKVVAAITAAIMHHQNNK